MVVPAIIPTSATHLRESVKPFSGVSEWIQIDLVDARFPAPSWPYKDASFAELGPVLAELAHTFSLEADLMVADADAILGSLKEGNVARIVVHPQGGTWPATSAYREQFKVGVAHYNDMPLEPLFEIIRAVDFVQCMGIAEVGAQEKGFDERVLANIRAIHQAFPEVPISVDGHVNAFTLPLLKHAGATRFAAGSSVVHAKDPIAAFRELERIANA